MHGLLYFKPLTDRIKTSHFTKGREIKFCKKEGFKTSIKLIKFKVY